MSPDQNKKNVIIIGGGVAGMAAAKALNDHHIHSHIIEQNASFGGHASQWACMATESCQHCSACLSQEMAEQMKALPHITPCLRSRITHLEKREERFHVELEGDAGGGIDADDIILATGFSPAQPPGLLKEAWQSSPRVITTAELNRDLKAGGSANILSQLPESPKIGFIQCVGSRNREIGKDYCSQVCCKISMRHVNKLLHLYPSADISLFYIDLQVIGKQTRSFFDRLSKQVTLVQGTPSEVFEGKMENKVSVIFEDSANAGRALSHFDLLVLSVGLHDSPAMAQIKDWLEIETDSFGFFPDSDALAAQRIWVAGTAQAPMDIQNAKSSGILAANRILNSYAENKVSDRSVVIVGDAENAEVMAKKLDSKGFSPVVLDPVSNILSVNGTAGQFEVLYQSSGETRQQKCTAIVAAPILGRRSAGRNLGLPEKNLKSLEQFSKIAESKTDGLADEITFWLDYSGPQRKKSSRKVLTEAIRLAGMKKKINVIMNKMLVHGMAGQKCYDEARRIGVRFFRVDSPNDVKCTMDKDKVCFTLKDTVLGFVELSFSSDWLVIPEYEAIPDTFAQIAGFFKEPLDSEGFLQSPNVRHQVVGSPKKGIYYLGDCHNETDDADMDLETDLILNAIMKIEKSRGEEPEVDIQVNRIKCKKCLTCYRICPHGAIVLDGNRPLIISQNCVACGLCVSSCPALAIESQKSPDETLLNSVESEKWTVFACERSGAIAAKAFADDDRLTVKTVPCVCRIGENILMKSAEKRGKIVLAGCHDQNCRSVEGSGQADIRTKWLKQIPAVDPGNVFWLPVAANESAKFDQFVSQHILKTKDQVKG